jgi:hypothetical protein
VLEEHAPDELEVCGLGCRHMHLNITVPHRHRCGDWQRVKHLMELPEIGKNNFHAVVRVRDALGIVSPRGNDTESPSCNL